MIAADLSNLPPGQTALDPRTGQTYDNEPEADGDEDRDRSRANSSARAALIVRVQAARVRQHPHAGVAEGGLLRPTTASGSRRRPGTP